MRGRIEMNEAEGTVRVSHSSRALTVALPARTSRYQARTLYVKDGRSIRAFLDRLNAAESLRVRSVLPRAQSPHKCDPVPCSECLQRERRLRESLRLREQIARVGRQVFRTGGETE